MKQTPLAKVSKRLARELVKYRELKQEYLHPSRACEACFTRKAIHVHHKRGREGKRLNEVEYWMPVCMECHRWITDNGKEAIKRGWVIKR